MNFEKQIRLIANEIYSKVVRFVYNNKENDDIFYDYAYINLNNEKQVMFNFNKGDLYITPSSEEGFNTFVYELKINNDEISYMHNNRHQLSVSYLEQLNLLLDNMKYNREKTHTVDNFNSDVFDIYTDYMYKKELSKKELFPAAIIAANWLVEKIGYLINNYWDKTKNEIDSKNYITNDQMIKLKNILVNMIIQKVYEADGDVIKIVCYDSFDVMIKEAMKELKLNIPKISCDITMYIRAYYVSVEDGYNNDITLYDSTEDIDIKNVMHFYWNNNVDLINSKKIGMNSLIKRI